VTYATVPDEYKPGAGRNGIAPRRIISPLNFLDIAEPFYRESEPVPKGVMIKSAWLKAAGIDHLGVPGDPPHMRTYDTYFEITWRCLNRLPEYEVNSILFKDSNLSIAFLTDIVALNAAGKENLKRELSGNTNSTSSDADDKTALAAAFDQLEVGKKKEARKKKKTDLQMALQKTFKPFTYIRLLRQSVISLHLFKYGEIERLIRSVLQAKGGTEVTPVLSSTELEELQHYLGRFHPVSSSLLEYELRYRVNDPGKLTELVAKEQGDLETHKEWLKIHFKKDTPLSASLLKTLLSIKPIYDEASEELYMSSRMIDVLVQINDFLNLPRWQEVRGEKVAEDTHHKLLVFCTRPKALALLGLHMRRMFGVCQHGENTDLPWTYGHYHERLSDSQRSNLVAVFNDETSKLSVLLMTYGVGAQALNLQGGNVVIHMDKPWTQNLVEQSENRVFRTGQTKTVHVVEITSMFNGRVGAVVSTEEAREFLDNAMSTTDYAMTRLLESKRYKHLYISHERIQDVNNWTIDHYIAAARLKRRAEEEEFEKMVNEQFVSKGLDLFSDALPRVAESMKAFDQAMRLDV
jgi:hypothetical protein